MKLCRIGFALLLALSFMMPMFSASAAEGVLDSPADVEQALSGLNGTQALKWEDFWANSTYVAGKNGTISRTKVTSGTGLFAEYLSFDLTAFGTNAGSTDTQISLRDTSGKFGFKGNIAAGDVYMLRMIIRSTPDDATKPIKFHMSIYGEGSSSQYPATSAHPDDFFVNGKTDDLPTVWTEYYIPLQAHKTYAPDKILLFLNPGGGTGTVDLACMEIVNYGKSVTLDQLPAATIDLTDYSKSGRTVLYWESFYNRATKSQTSPAVATLTKVSDAEGMFSRYLSIDASKISGSYKNVQLNYLDYKSNSTTTPKGWGLFGNAKAGDTVLIHLILRSDAADGEGSFRLAFYQQGVNSSDTAGTAAALEKMTVSNLWTEFYIPVTAGSVDPSRASIFLGYEIQTLDVAMFEIIDYNDADISTLPSSKTVIEAGYGEEYDFFEKFAGAESQIFVDGLTTAKALSGSQTVDISDADCYCASDKLLFSFAMKAESECTPVTITLNTGKTTEMTYYVPVQWTRYNMPIQVGSLQSVTISGDVLLAEAKFQNRKSDTFESMSVESGPWLMEDFADVTIEDTGDTLVGKTKDMVKVGGLLYSIGDSKLTITDVSDYKNPKVLSTLDGMGNAIRQITMLGDGKHVFISSRQNGCYVVNIEDPNAPWLVSRYDSVEMATGIAAYGNFVYIANRQYGVEIVDITDVNNPVQCAIVRCGTVQSCEVVDGILYAGCWNERAIYMFDVTQPSEPVALGVANLTGKGDGVFVIKQGEKTYMYAATGQNPLGVTENTSTTKTEEILLSDLNLGMGNGVDIFDVTDPANPIWLSSTKIDGRYYYADNDFWHVEVAEENGKYYAYFLNTYNGVYVFDVTDPKAPVRLGHIVVTSDRLSKQYYSGRVNIFPYDQDVQRQSPIAGIAVENGVLYMASISTDLHIYDGEDLAKYLYEPEEKSQTVQIQKDKGTFYNFDSTGIDGFDHYKTLGQAYTIVEHNGKLYLAAGKQGVLVLDKDLNLLGSFGTNDLTIDVQICNGTMYCAESGGGLAAYQLSEDGLSATELWRYTTDRGVVRHIRLSPKGNWALIQCGSTYGQIVSTNSPTEAAIEVKANSQMYHHNILNQMAGGRYLGIYAESGKTWWFDFGAEDDYETPVQIAYWTSNGAAIMTGGMTGNVPGYDNHVLCTRNVASGNTGGYYIYDITAEAPTVVINAKDPDTSFSGRPTIVGNILIASDRINGLIHIVDISDLANPNVIKTITVSGNPDSALVVGDDILIPMGYQGLFKFSISQFMTAQVCCDGETSGYDSLQDAIDAAEGGYVKLMKDVTEDVVISGDTYLDLNGKTLTGSVTGDGTLYGMDSATDGYSTENMGRITGTVSCQLQPNFKSDLTGSVRRYMVIADQEGVTFHRFYLGVTHINLKPGVTGVGYKAVFAGDDMVKAQIEYYGFNLWVGAGQKHTASKTGDTFTSLKTVTLRLQNFDVENYGEASINATVFIVLSDGTTIESGAYSYTLRSLLETVNSNVSSFTQEQMSALKAMCQVYSDVMADWDIGNVLK